MFVSELRLINFRSYCDTVATFGSGLNVVVGANATGKTNLLEGAWFALRGGSPRTRREEKLLLWGAPHTRVELSLQTDAGQTLSVEIGYAPRQGKRLRWRGTEVDSLEDLRERSQVFIFVPESLLLIKGSPARRRAHLDVFASSLDRQYAAAARDLQDALRQRNAQLTAVKYGGHEGALDPWDTQFARAAAELGSRRQRAVADLSEHFSAAAASLAGEGEEYTLQLVTQLPGTYDVAELVDELRIRRPGEIQRGVSMYGPQRDDVRFIQASPHPRTADPMDRRFVASAACGPVSPPLEGRDLRLFGSQGEQRLAVLALLIAEREIAARLTGEAGMLFLDDVMSELDDGRRRKLVGRLAEAGQVIITTTNIEYFTAAELARATVLELPLEGSVLGSGVVSAGASKTAGGPEGDPA